MLDTIRFINYKLRLYDPQGISGRIETSTKDAGERFWADYLCEYLLDKAGNRVINKVWRKGDGI